MLIKSVSCAFGRDSPKAGSQFVKRKTDAARTMRIARLLRGFSSCSTNDDKFWSRGGDVRVLHHEGCRHRANNASTIEKEKNDVAKVLGLVPVVSLPTTTSVKHLDLPIGSAF
jgi:hypothetical protein